MQNCLQLKGNSSENISEVHMKDRTDFGLIPKLVSESQSISQIPVYEVYEDEIFGRQDILQFFSGESKDYKYVKFPQTFLAL